MRLFPSQLALQLICGRRVHPLLGNKPLHVRLKEGHDMLVGITGKDFGYDLQAWHDHLKESREGGYTYGRNIVLPKIAKEAIQSAEWNEAVRLLTTPPVDPAAP